MHRPCGISWCRNPARSPFGRYCNAHSKRDRRHGHPLQPSITRSYLKPYAKRIESWLARHTNPDLVWEKLDASLQHLVNRARGELLARERGAVGFQHSADAARDIVHVAENADIRKAVMAVLSITLLWDEEPGAFKSDEAFWVQTARLWRGLAREHVASRWDDRRQRVQRLYRDPSPKSAVELGRRLALGLGPFAMEISRRMKVAAEDEQRIKREVFDALNGSPLS